MDHCAIDVGGKKSQICVRDSGGTIQFEGAWETLALGDHLRQLPHSRVILETAAQSFRIADQARAAGHEVRVVPAPLVRTLGVGARRTKTFPDATGTSAMGINARGDIVGGWCDGTIKPCWGVTRDQSRLDRIP